MKLESSREIVRAIQEADLDLENGLISEGDALNIGYALAEAFLPEDLFSDDDLHEWAMRMDYAPPAPPVC